MVRHGLIGGLFVVSSLLTLHPVAAQSPSEIEKIERLERQVELLQKQITALQAERRQEKLKQTSNAKQSQTATGTPSRKGAQPESRRQPEQPREEVRRDPDLAYHPLEEREGSPETAKTAPTPARWLNPEFAGVNFSWWGWFEAATVFREHNQVNDMLTVFNAIPYPFSPLYNEHEFHGSARQSQFSLLVDGNNDAAQKLAGYLEFDFLAVGTESNYLVTNDWPLRLRHGYITYDNDNWGFHLLAGQQWSMVMPEMVGIVPRKELVPLTINANYLVGYNFTDNWQIRFVKDFDKTVWLGLSLENPATILPTAIPGGTLVNVGRTGTSTDDVDGLAVNVINTGTGGFLNDVPVTPSVAPDIVEKIAWDPGWGHFEALAIQRFFYDNTLCVTALPAGCVVGRTSAKTSFGAGVGGNVLLPAIPKYLDVMGGVMYGTGIGRYGAGNLPDVTIAQDGSLTPLTALHAWAGMQIYPWEGLTLYAYGGIEQNEASYFGTFGYGNPAFDNSGCLTPTLASFTTGTTPACVADNRRLTDVHVGFWQDLYNGSVGRFVFGAELEYLMRESFRGIGGAPSTDNTVGFTSVRYYW
jgi:hypothetical protein